MTQNTEQERAAFEVWARDRYPSIDLTRDGDDYSKALAKDYWSLWQAARRAQVVPRGWKLVPVDPTSEMLKAAWKHGVDDEAPEPYYAYKAMLAAAPQPPECVKCAQHDNGQTGEYPCQACGLPLVHDAVPQPPEATVKDCLQVAAPVQLPEPFAYVEHHKAGDNLWFDCPGGKYSGLYTEHQIRQLLADHGVK